MDAETDEKIGRKLRYRGKVRIDAEDGSTVCYGELQTRTEAMDDGRWLGVVAADAPLEPDTNYRLAFGDGRWVVRAVGPWRNAASSWNYHAQKGKTLVESDNEPPA